MITQEKAEVLARVYLQRFVNDCQCETAEDAANVMMKMASVCGVSMCAVVGKTDAVMRMQGTTDFINSLALAAQPWKQERAN